jgi:hypothetical protein
LDRTFELVEVDALHPWAAQGEVLRRAHSSPDLRAHRLGFAKARGAGRLPPRELCENLAGAKPQPDKTCESWHGQITIGTPRR